MRRFFPSVLALLFPERCAACDAFLDGPPGLCDGCAQSLYPLGAACPTCAEPREGPGGALCGRCRRVPPPFRRVVAPWRYGGELAVAIRRLKYGGAGGAGRLELARPLGALLAPALAGLAADLLVPVPLHPLRLRARGFSQAQVLAVAARRAGRLALPIVVPGALRRTRDTEEQAGLGRLARRRNVSRAFQADPARVEGRTILLLDDVVTTGATAAECARALRRAGAQAVDVLALARAES